MMQAPAEVEPLPPAAAENPAGTDREPQPQPAKTTMAKTPAEVETPAAAENPPGTEPDPQPTKITMAQASVEVEPQSPAAAKNPAATQTHPRPADYAIHKDLWATNVTNWNRKKNQIIRVLQSELKQSPAALKRTLEYLETHGGTGAVWSAEELNLAKKGPRAVVVGILRMEKVGSVAKIAKQTAFRADRHTVLHADVKTAIIVAVPVKDEPTANAQLYALGEEKNGLKTMMPLDQASKNKIAFFDEYWLGVSNTVAKKRYDAVKENIRTFVNRSTKQLSGKNAHVPKVDPIVDLTKIDVLRSLGLFVTTKDTVYLEEVNHLLGDAVAEAATDVMRKGRKAPADLEGAVVIMQAEKRRNLDTILGMEGKLLGTKKLLEKDDIDSDVPETLGKNLQRLVVALRRGDDEAFRQGIIRRDHTVHSLAGEAALWGIKSIKASNDNIDKALRLLCGDEGPSIASSRQLSHPGGNHQDPVSAKRPPPLASSAEDFESDTGEGPSRPRATRDTLRLALDDDADSAYDGYTSDPFNEREFFSKRRKIEVEPKDPKDPMFKGKAVDRRNLEQLSRVEKQRYEQSRIYNYVPGGFRRPPNDPVTSPLSKTPASPKDALIEHHTPEEENIFPPFPQQQQQQQQQQNDGFQDEEDGQVQQPGSFIGSVFRRFW